MSVIFGVFHNAVIGRPLLRQHCDAYCLNISLQAFQTSQLYLPTQLPFHRYFNRGTKQILTYSQLKNISGHSESTNMNVNITLNLIT